MGTSIGDYIGATIGIHFPIPYYALRGIVSIVVPNWDPIR